MAFGTARGWVLVLLVGGPYDGRTRMILVASLVGRDLQFGTRPLASPSDSSEETADKHVVYRMRATPIFDGVLGAATADYLDSDRSNADVDYRLAFDATSPLLSEDQSIEPPATGSDRDPRGVAGSSS